MIPAIDAGTCLVFGLSAVLTSSDLGWDEAVELEVQHRDGCVGVDLVVPDGIRLSAVTGTVRSDRVPNYKLPPERTFRTRLEADGTRTYTVWLADLEDGDQADLVFTRHWERPVDYGFEPGASGFAQVKLPRGARHTHAGFADDGRWTYTTDPEIAWLQVSHPWAGRDPAPPVHTDTQGLSADAAAEQAAALAYLPRAAFGRRAPAGDEALALGAVDDRGYARTVLGLTHGGPDEVALARWTPYGPEVSPAPGALEMVAVKTATGFRLLKHPDQALRTGTVHTPWGDRSVVQSAPEAPGDRLVIPTPLTGRGGLAEGAVTVTLPARVADALSPKGGAVVHYDYRVSWDDTDTPRVQVVPLPPGVTAATVDHGRATTDAVWIVAPPGVGRATVRFAVPMGDVWGTYPLPVEEVTGRVERADGTTDAGDRLSPGIHWHLESLDGQALLTDEGRLVRELQGRVATAAFPEPSTPRKLRGHATGWELATMYPSLLAERSTVARLPTDAPLMPRPLAAARRTRVLTPFEAAATVMFYARQARMDAHWYLARPHGGIDDVSPHPAAWTDAVVRVTHDGETRWLAPSCATCAAWELPASLVGAEILGPEGRTRLPEPELVLQAFEGGLWMLPGTTTPGTGRTQLDRTPEETRWLLTGTDAQALRAALHGLPGDALPGAVAQHLTGNARTASALVEVTGTGDLGADIAVVMTPEVPVLDPILGATSVGVRASAWQTDLPDGETTCDGEGWSWRSVVRGGRRVEQLWVQQRVDEPQDRDAALGTCRADFEASLSPTPPPSPPEPPPP